MSVCLQGYFGVCDDVLDIDRDMHQHPSFFGWSTGRLASIQGGIDWDTYMFGCVSCHIILNFTCACVIGKLVWDHEGWKGLGEKNRMKVFFMSVCVCVCV